MGSFLALAGVVLGNCSPHNCSSHGVVGGCVRACVMARACALRRVAMRFDQSLRTLSEESSGKGSRSF
eukprot:11451264-Alexandrium_andersonii.AAC.1